MVAFPFFLPKVLSVCPYDSSWHWEDIMWSQVGLLLVSVVG